MVSKRGMLAIDEVIKIILGIAVLFFIILILFVFGKMVSNSLREEQAQATMNDLVYTINNLPEGTDKEFVVEGPSSWFFYSHNDQFCFLPMSCLSVLNTSSLLTAEEIAAGKDNILPICKNSGFCNSSMNVSIPYDTVDYKTGRIINYYAQYIFGSSELVMAEIYHAILIGEKTIPQTIKLRKLKNVTTIINVPSTKELQLITTLISTANSLNVGSSSNLNFSDVKKEYLHFGSILINKDIKVVCICDSKDINECGKTGLCTISNLKLILKGDNLQILEKNPILNVTRVNDESFTVALSA